MAVKKTLTKSIPHVKSSKVEQWDLEMTYENDNEGDATYYKTVFEINVPWQTIMTDAYTDIDGNNVPAVTVTNFTKAAKSSFNLAALTALCPTAHWDKVFACQVDSVITNPPAQAVPDNNFAVPSS